MLVYRAFHWIIELQHREQGLKILFRSISIIGQSYFWFWKKKFWWLGSFFHFHSFHVNEPTWKLKIVPLKSEKALSVSILLAPPPPFHPNTSTSLHKCIITVSLCLWYPPASIYRDLGTVFWGLRRAIMSLSRYELGQRENNTHNRSYIGHYLSLCSHPARLPPYLSVWL